MHMEYGQAFPSAAREPGFWRKFLVAGAISLIPVVGWILGIGYAQTVARRVTQDQQPALPDWSDWSALFRRGLGWIGIMVVYLLPLAGLIGLLSALNFAIDSTFPNLVTPAIGPVAASTTALVLALCANIITIGYGILAVLMLIAAGGRYAASDRMVDAFRLGEIWRTLTRRPGVYLIILILNSVMFAVLGVVGVVACGIGLAWGSAYATLVAGHLSGQAHRSAGTVLDY